MCVISCQHFLQKKFKKKPQLCELWDLIFFIVIIYQDLAW